MSQIKVDSIVPRGGIVSGAEGGGIVQVVNEPLYTQLEMSPGSSFTQIPNWSASITPRSSSNKILVNVSLNVAGNSDYYVVAVRLYINGSYQEVAPNNGNRLGTFMTVGAQQWNNYFRYQAYGQYLHSPASTSQQTYTLYVRDPRDNGNVNINRAHYDSNSSLYNPVGSSCITLMEISG